MRGKFIVLEGIDGSGKTTQIKRLVKALPDIYTTMEPTCGEMGRLLRKYLSGELKSDSRAIAALFAADRLDHVANTETGILNKINNGITVVSDRYYFSSYAYQGVDVDMDWVVSLNSQAKALLKPDLQIFIDISPQTAMDRITLGRDAVDVYEEIGRLSATREKFLDIIRGCPDENVVIVDGNCTEEKVAERILKEVKRLVE